MVVASFNHYFSFFGIAIVTISALLFWLGTILGNSYNGSQCFGYFTNNKKSSIYLVATAVMIFLGCVLDAKLFWSFVDIFVALPSRPHVVGAYDLCLQEITGNGNHLKPSICKRVSSLRPIGPSCMDFFGC